MNEFEIQQFAEGEGADGGSGTDAESGAEADETEKAAVDEQTDIQAKIDLAVVKAVKRAEAEYRKREAAAKKEAERLGKLSDDERQKAELENTRKELESQRLEFEREKLKYETTKVVAQRGLPVEFTEYLIADDSEATLDRIKTFEKFYKKAIEDGVNEKLKGKAPVKTVEAPARITGGLEDIIRKNQVTR